MEILKVSAQSDSSATGGALANAIRQMGSAELQGIGPKAINQAVKAIAIARSYLASSGVDLVAIPSFVDVDIDGQPRTAIRFLTQARHRLAAGATWHPEEKAVRPTEQRAEPVQPPAQEEPPREPEAPTRFDEDLEAPAPRLGSFSEAMSGLPDRDDEPESTGPEAETPWKAWERPEVRSDEGENAEEIELDRQEGSP